jgi:basic membrane protein A
MRRNGLLMVLVVMLGMTMAFAGGKSEAQPSAPASATKAFKAIYLVNGSLGDKGFYDSAASGFYAMRDTYGADIKIVEMGRNEASYESYLLDVSEQDWDVITTGTWSVLELTKEVAAQYPDKHYLFFDGAIQADNVMSITYRSEQTGFMAGALAASMLSVPDPKIDPSKKILGFVGSMDTPNINDFLVGYIEGIKYIDPSIRVLTSYVGSFEDVSKCMEMTTQAYNQGAQIVYTPASQSILGAASASSDADKYLIGCDTDLWTALKDTDPNKVRNVISSSLKNVGQSLTVAMRGLQDGSMQVGKVYNLGIESGAVGLAKNANYEKIVPQAVRDNLETIAAKVASGEISVDKAVGTPTEQVAALRDSMKP